MLGFTIIIPLLFVSISASLPSEEDAVEKLQTLMLRLQLEAQAAKLRSGISTRKSSLAEVGLSIEELISYYGYPSETHEVTTEDGYILTLHRIPHGINNAQNTNKPAVFVMPGLFSDAGLFLSNGEKESLGFWLANQGYDVWIGDYRGTTRSKKHLSLDPDNDKSFWDYSFDEIGYYDIPALIDYILYTTKQEKLFYIGHSQGTTSFFTMASQRPEYNDKIRLMVALAPIAYMGNNAHPFLKILVQNKDVLYALAETLHFYEIFPHWDLITTIGTDLCSDDAATQAVCVSVMGTIAGIEEKKMNKTLLPLVMSHFPAGASVKQLMHYAQEILSGHFRKYDYGLIGNMAKYGKLTPPEFDIEKITAPVALFYSYSDMFANMDDVKLLAAKLPNVVKKHLVEDDEFTHLDFCIASDVVELVYEKVLDVFNKY